MIVFQDSSTGTVAGIGDRRIVDCFVRFLSARLNGEARFPLVLKALRDSGTIGVDRIDEAVLEARSIDRILGNATSYGMEEVRSLKAEESGDFVWRELLRVMELTATYRTGSFLVRELGFWRLLDDLGNKRRSKKKGIVKMSGAGRKGVDGAIGQINSKDRGSNMKRSFSASVTKEDGIYVAQCLEVDIASQGSSPEESLANLQEALALYFEDPRPTITPDIKKIEVEIGAA